MNFTNINRNTNFRPNHVQRVNEEKVSIANISRNNCKDLIEVFTLLHERLRTISDKLDFERVVSNALNIIRERKEELIRIKRLEDMKSNAGYALISIIIIFGILGFALITYIVIKNLLY